MSNPSPHSALRTPHPQAPQDAWELISWLIKEATEMTGDEAADHVRINRGADWIAAYRKAFPVQAAFFIDGLIQGTADEAMRSLAVWQPQLANLPYARRLIEGMQKKLRGGK